MVTATAADYAWWTQWRPEWAEAHCVTLLSDCTAQDLLTALKATLTGVVNGIDAFYHRAIEGYDPAEAVIGVTDLDGGWTLIAEVNGYVGVTESLMGLLSPGRTIVSHFRNINAVYQFQWWRDGKLLVDFDPMFSADSRFGADPDVVLDDLLDLGMLRTEGDIDFSAASFALAQRITGVELSPALFEGSDFLTATVAVP